MLPGPQFLSNCSIGSAAAFVRLTPQGTIAKLAAGANDNTPGGALALGPDGRLYGTAAPVPQFWPPKLQAFATDTDGHFTLLHQFGPTESGGHTLLSGPDGNFYSTLTEGGAAGKGIVYRMTPDGAVTTLREFVGGVTDGDSPSAGLVLNRDGYFYGVTSKGGPANAGTIFRINAAGDFSVVYSFTGGADGSDPEAALIQSQDGSLYGTTAAGGLSGAGVVYRIKSVTPAPVLTIGRPRRLRGRTRLRSSPAAR